VLCDELKDYFSLSLVMKIKSKAKMQKLRQSPKHRSPGGIEERELVAPLILL
jgi:hypothetical protein